MSDSVLAVIIPHYNDLDRLAKCLEALAPQLAAHPQIDCLVVDNDSPCDLGPLKTAYPGIRFVCEATKGAAAARNRGVAETTAPGLLFIDSDCVPRADCLATALRLLPDLIPGQPELLGGRVETFDETPAPRSGAEAFETVFAFDQKSYVEKKGFSVTANLLTTRAVFDATGPMVVGLSEDVDWCRRATACGHVLAYNDALVVAHPTRQDWPALSKKWRRTTHEMYHSAGTSPKARVKWGIRALAMVASILPHIPQIFTNDRLSGTERWRALSMLIRLRLSRAFWMLQQAVTGKFN